jgi:hypothetical protein
MTDYTKAQKETIDRAFSQLTELVSNRDHRSEYRFHEAFKADRKERSTITASKALLIEAFLDGWHGKPALGDVSSYAEGPMMLVLIGATWKQNAERYPDGQYAPTEAQMALFTGAVLAQRHSIEARMEAMR